MLGCTGDPRLQPVATCGMKGAGLFGVVLLGAVFGWPWPSKAMACEGEQASGVVFGVFSGSCCIAREEPGWTKPLSTGVSSCRGVCPCFPLAGSADLGPVRCLGIRRL